jgi:mRNA interferase RelE/StbE
MSKVVIHHNAAKYIKRLPLNAQKRIKEVLKQLEKRPLGHSDVKHMLGEWKGYHRIRVGKMRIIFYYDEAENTLYIDHVGPRGDVYK